MLWDKFVKPEFITVWSRLPADEKRAITEAMAMLAQDPLNYQPTPVRLINGDLLLAELHYWIQYRLDASHRRIIFVKLRRD